MTKRSGNAHRDLAGSTDGRERDPRRSVAELRCYVLRRLERQARLPGTTRTNQRDEAIRRLRKQRADLILFILTTDQAIRGAGKAWPRLFRRCCCRFDG